MPRPGNGRAAVLWALALTATALLVMRAVRSVRAPRVDVLESAILPPRAFRRWVDASSRVETGPVNEIPLDRFAGRGRGRRTAARVPGYLDREAKQALEEYMQQYRKLEPEIKELDEKMAATATWDHGHGDGRSADGSQKESLALEEKREALDAKIAKAKAEWRRVQDKVDAKNKEMVNGKIYRMNKDNGLGGSDHFVPAGQAHKQLAGGGYGHQYSIVDWLSGDRR